MSSAKNHKIRSQYRWHHRPDYKPFYINARMGVEKKVHQQITQGMLAGAFGFIGNLMHRMQNK